MKRVCAWCGTEMEEVDSGEAEKYSISHGICESCAARLSDPDSSTLLSYLELLPYPVMVVDDDVTVLAANQQALAILGKRREDVADRVPGLVVECAYSYRPEGCGHTEHCRGCVIRNSIQKTFETGLALNHVPAVLSTRDGDRFRDIEHHISTERIGNLVTLRLDDLKVRM